jgi:hypothetical protein
MLVTVSCATLDPNKVIMAEWSERADKNSLYTSVWERSVIMPHRFLTPVYKVNSLLEIL